MVELKNPVIESSFMLENPDVVEALLVLHEEGSDVGVSDHDYLEWCGGRFRPVARADGDVQRCCGMLAADIPLTPGIMAAVHLLILGYAHAITHFRELGDYVDLSGVSKREVEDALTYLVHVGYLLKVEGKSPLESVYLVGPGDEAKAAFGKARRKFESKGGISGSLSEHLHTIPTLREARVQAAQHDPKGAAGVESRRNTSVAAMCMAHMLKYPGKFVAVPEQEQRYAA
jgi:hypothetical protein